MRASASLAMLAFALLFAAPTRPADASAAQLKLSGTYTTNYGNLHLRQDGNVVTGCYEFEGGVVSDGHVNGQILRFTWVQPGPRGPAVFTFVADGRDFTGLWWYEGKTDQAGQPWSGKKISDEVGRCEHWPAPAAAK